MNFIKKEGEEVKNLFVILAEDFQHKLRQKLLKLGKINLELDEDFKGSNTSANFCLNGKSYPNTTYSTFVPSVDLLEFAANKMSDDFIKNLPEKCHISFRLNFRIDPETEYKHSGCILTFRAATVIF